VSFIVPPLALINISIGMNESASAVSPVVKPVSFIEGIIWPNLFALTVAHAITKLPDIPGSIFHRDWAFSDERGQVFIVGLEWSESERDLAGDLIVEVFRL
jgi:hypothetical protein